MQMTSKLEETKRKAAIINKTKRRLRGPEQEFKAGDGELRRGREEEEARNPSKEAKSSLRLPPPRKPALQPTG